MTYPFKINSFVQFFNYKFFKFSLLSSPVLSIWQCPCIFAQKYIRLL